MISRFRSPMVVSIAALMLTMGCSTSPPVAQAQTPVQAPAAPAVAAAVPTATVATKPSANPAVPLTPDLAALTKAARTQGYTPRNHNGKIVYCKTEPQIGTRFESTSCISQADVANVLNRATGNRESIEEMQRKSLLQSQCHMLNGASMSGC